MKNNLINILNFINETLNKNDFKEDAKKIKYFYDEIEKMKTKLPTTKELEELKDIEIDLEVKYEAFNELSNYFDPIYAETKHNIHNEKVNKLREENRKKRERI